MTRVGLLRRLAGNEILLALLLLSAAAALLLPTFLTDTNARNILNQASVLGILACAEFLVVLIGGFDLSVAAVMALSSVLFATLAPTSIPLASAAALGAGVLLGVVSAVSVTVGRVPPLIATLGCMGIARGLAFVVSEKSVSVAPSLLGVARGEIWILSAPVVTWIVVALLLAWLLANTRFGRNLYAIGGNEHSARLAGVAVDRCKFSVYVLSGVLSALAGLALVARTSSGVPQIGTGWELDAIAAIVIGGTQLSGGEGSLLKAMLGVIIYRLIANIMNLANLDPYYQDIVRAILIISVVGLSVMKSRRRLKVTT